jgi:hypothetical protein
MRGQNLIRRIQAVHVYQSVNLSRRSVPWKTMLTLRRELYKFIFLLGGIRSGIMGLNPCTIVEWLLEIGKEYKWCMCIHKHGNRIHYFTHFSVFYFNVTLWFNNWLTISLVMLLYIIVIQHRNGGWIVFTQKLRHWCYLVLMYWILIKLLPNGLRAALIIEGMLSSGYR